MVPPERLRLYNTLTRRRERFRSHREKHVRMFTCGPSVYQPAHIGNYRTFIAEDILHRYLEFKKYRVGRVMNLTDVEDKAIQEARSRGMSLRDLTDENTHLFLEGARTLGITIPSELPRASENVEEAVALIRRLLEKDYAYRHDGDIFFDPLKYRGFGRLYGLDMSRWPKKKRRFRQDTYPGNRWNLGDFILWHGARDGGSEAEPVWDTPIGRGRPSWNIQDPAIISAHLGESIDIAMGGADNLYRHHDYTLAVMESLSGKRFARHWLHAELLFVHGEKMSKSRNNIVYLDDLLDRGYSPAAVRCFLMCGSYREPLNFTPEKMSCTQGDLARTRQRLERLMNVRRRRGKTDRDVRDRIERIERSFVDRMDDDLDVAGAVSALDEALDDLTALDQDGRFGEREARLLRQAITRIDSVLNVLAR